MKAMNIQGLEKASIIPMSRERIMQKENTLFEAILSEMGI